MVFHELQVVYAGDNFVRYTGDVGKVNQLELFAWQAAEQGKNIHITSNPSLSELMYQQYKQSTCI